MRILSSVALGATLCLTAAPAGAQRNIGISFIRSVGVIVLPLGGFDCSSSTNTGRVTAAGNERIAVRLHGEAGFPAAVLLGAGPASLCPGFAIPGIGNALLVDLASLLVVGSSTGLPRVNAGSCGETGSQPVFSITLPLLRPGTLIHFQGLVFDSGAPAFTRPLELTIR